MTTTKKKLDQGLTVEPKAAPKSSPLVDSVERTEKKVDEIAEALRIVKEQQQAVLDAATEIVKAVGNVVKTVETAETKGELRAKAGRF